jgi:hypothetical protein
MRDYVTGYLVWLVAGLVPGLHHVYLGNYWRGLKYFITMNEAIAGWALDLLELHILIQKSVQERGHVIQLCPSCCCSSDCWCCGCCCCCCPPSSAEKNGNHYEDNDVEAAIH